MNAPVRPWPHNEELPWPSSIDVMSFANATTLDMTLGDVFGEYNKRFECILLLPTVAYTGLWTDYLDDLRKRVDDMSPWDRRRFIETYLRYLITR